MSPEELKQHIRQITVWKRGEQRAPHKPLLLLYALERCLNDGSFPSSFLWAGFSCLEVEGQFVSSRTDERLLNRAMQINTVAVLQ